MTVPDSGTGRERTGSSADPDRWPVTRAARGLARRAALPRAAAFWLVAGVLRGNRRARRGSRGQPDLPPPLCRPAASFRKPSCDLMAAGGATHHQLPALWCAGIGVLARATTSRSW